MQNVGALQQSVQTCHSAKAHDAMQIHILSNQHVYIAILHNLIQTGPVASQGM